LYQKARQFDDKFLYINFEDERLVWFEAKDLNLFLEKYEYIFDREPEIILLDEIQNIQWWWHFVRRLKDFGKKVIVTGSNAKMLSNEIYSTLWGRLKKIEVFPLSFKEYLIFKWQSLTRYDLLKNKVKILKYFEEYMLWWGFPEVYDRILIEKRQYLNDIFHSVFYRDVVARYDIQNELWLKLFFKKLAENVWRLYSFNSLKNKLKQYVKISTNTIINFHQYAEESFVIKSIRWFSDPFYKQINYKKTYFIDSWLLNIFFVDQKSKLLENVVFTHLWRQFYDVYYFYEDKEVDFVIFDWKKIKQAIQVCYSLDDEETLEREINWLEILNKKFKVENNFILTFSEEGQLKLSNWKTVQVMPVWKYLIF
jgi:predicted AAA+ superfamily ATPase